MKNNLRASGKRIVYDHSSLAKRCNRWFGWVKQLIEVGKIEIPTELEQKMIDIIEQNHYYSVLDKIILVEQINKNIKEL